MELANVIGLQFLGPIKDDSQSISPTAGFELGKKGTIVLPTSIVKGGELVPTSWPSAGKPTDAVLEVSQGALRSLNNTLAVYIYVAGECGAENGICII